MSAQTLSSSSSNSMDAQSQSCDFERRSSSPETGALSSPESCPASVGFIDMSDLMLPASALESELFGIPKDSNATVVSTASHDEIPSAVFTTTSTAATMATAPGLSRNKKRKSSSSASSERRHCLPTTLMLDQLSNSEVVTQPVPEFLCHLFSILRDPSNSELISWSVPTEDEADHDGGGMKGIGKIVVHKPDTLQDFVLGNYYRHSKYASFQRQLNYFGFKKRLHGGKKGKLSPCSYIHELLTEDAGSLLELKRRPPSKKRLPSQEIGDEDCVASVSSHDDTNTSSAKSNKKCRVTVEKIIEKSRKNHTKKDKKKKKCVSKGKPVVSISHLDRAEEYTPPSTQSSAAIESNLSKVQADTTTSMATPLSQVIQPPITPTRSSASSPASQPTLLDLLSTSLPPPEILFNDAVDVNSLDAKGIPAWVTDDGKHHYHNVDSFLIDLAMLY